MAKYTLPISHHTAKSLCKLQSPATRSTLVNIGFNQHTSLVVVFGAVNFGGLAFRDLAVEQGIKQLCLIIRHIRSETDQGNLLMITLHWWQLVAGISVPLWEHLQPPICYLHHNWLTSVRDFLASSQGSLSIEGIMLDFPQPNRTDGQCIMDVISLRSATSASTLWGFNRCQIYMQVTFLFEISTADGLRIGRQHWIGQCKCNSSLLWPYQPAPGPNSFCIWCHLLATTFLSGHHKWVCPCTIDLHLQHPLGMWLHTPSSWLSFFSPSTRQLYQINSKRTLDIHSRTLGPRIQGSPTCIAFHLQPHDSQALSTLPPDAAPVDLIMHLTFLASS
jgi:hypothetical protein